MKNKTSNDNLYYAFLILYFILIIGYVLYLFVFRDIFQISECVIYKNFGIYCPGCGGTRAVISLLQGNLCASFYYHPIILCFFVITFIYVFLNTLARILNKEKLKIPFYKGFGYFLITVIVINFVIKNFLLLKLGIKM